MLVTNLIGDRGENAVSMCFVKPVAKHNGFEPHFLGPKAQLLDFHVSLLNPSGKAFGPHFFVQVKTSHVKPSPMFKAGFNGTCVTRAKAGLAPVYVAGVEIDGDKERVWICGIESQSTLNSIPKLYNLRNASTLKKLYGEVLSHFQASAYSFKTSLK
ncbi:hypothetical protein RBH89_15500 [Paracidovorax avenae]